MLIQQLTNFASSSADETAALNQPSTTVETLLCSVKLYIGNLFLGTSDEHLSITQYLAGAGIDGAIVVTTPQEISLQVHTGLAPKHTATITIKQNIVVVFLLFIYLLQDVRKEINFCRKVNLPVLGKFFSYFLMHKYKIR